MTSSKPSYRRVHILLVEDSQADVLITQEALEQAHLANITHVVDDGVKALAYLRRTAPYADAPRPDLILLDLNLPRVNGREVLGAIKSDPALSLIPVIVFTTSRSEEDVANAYRLGANCYIVKPVEFRNFVAAIQAIRNFWFSIVTLPPDV